MFPPKNTIQEMLRQCIERREASLQYGTPIIYSPATGSMSATYIQVHFRVLPALAFA